MNKTGLTLIFLAACLILSVNAIKSIFDSYNTGSVYQERKQQTEQQYLEVIKKKNELDYINSPFFVEKQLRESLNYYRRGEKLLVFTQSPVTQNNSTTKSEKPAITQWIELLQFGIRGPFER